MKEKDVKENRVAETHLAFHNSIVKRDGSLAPFQSKKIFNAIAAAFLEVKKDLSLECRKEIVSELSKEVVEKVLSDPQRRPSVEGTQDIVEATLMERGFHDVARAYILYREEHKKQRLMRADQVKLWHSKRGISVRFQTAKISASLENAFKEAQNLSDPLSEQVICDVNAITKIIVDNVVVEAEKGHQITTKSIQEMVEDSLMSRSFHREAKAYILLQSDLTDSSILSKERSLQKELFEKQFTVKREDKSTFVLEERELRNLFSWACRGLEKETDREELLRLSLSHFYEGITEKEVDLSNVMAAKALIERDPAYSKVTARLLLDRLFREVFQTPAHSLNVRENHLRYFKDYIAKGVALQRLSAKMLEFDLDQLGLALNLQRDDDFSYLGLQTLYDRYFIHEKEQRLETPQIFWMRVAMGLALEEKEKEKRAIEFYNILSTFRYMTSTPTLFNSGTCRSQLSSCYLATTSDDLQGIFKVISDNAQLSKWAGGLGNDWTNVRASGAHIKGTNGLSQGVIPFLKIVNDTAVAVNQGGKRKGATCVYLETWHLDIEDFLELRKNTGDERRRTPDMNTANWVPDLFIKRVRANQSWTLFSPDDVADLHDLYGEAFEKRYCEYERMTHTGEIKLFKKLEAVDLWRKMLSMLFETGHPWITFKDPSNIRSPQDHKGVIHSSNLCTEILLNTSSEEIAVCNLGSVNLAEHTTEAGLDERKLAQTIQTAVRMLDNVVDINFYAVKEAKEANLRHRPIGLGLMGFQDALYKQGISYASPEAVDFSDASMEMISFYAILASSNLAKERGVYSSYQGSKWDRGLLPIDTIELLERERGEPVTMDREVRMDWQRVREELRSHGMRNSNVMAIAPTATIANIVGVTQSIEPMYKHLFTKSNLSGEFTVINPFLVSKLKKLGLWDKEMIDDLKYFDGSLAEITRIPAELRDFFRTAFEIDGEWLVECGSRRQKWLDMSQSLNLYLAVPSGRRLQDLFMFAWEKGIKTTYYLRSLGATQIEKSTVDINKRGLQPRWMKSKSASSNISVQRDSSAPLPSCDLGEECESCQ